LISGAKGNTPNPDVRRIEGVANPVNSRPLQRANQLTQRQLILAKSGFLVNACGV
jgi:hypothetical protein